MECKKMISLDNPKEIRRSNTNVCIKFHTIVKYVPSGRWFSIPKTLVFLIFINITACP